MCPTVLVTRRAPTPRGRRIIVLTLVAALVALMSALVMRARPTTTFAGTLPVGSGPQEVALDAHTGYAFVTNNAASTVTMLDTHNGAVRRTIPVVNSPLEVGVDATTSRAFVVNTSGEVSVLDTTTGDLLRTLAVSPLANRELCHVVVDERNDRVLISMGNGTTPSILTFLDGRTGAMLRQVPVGKFAKAVAVDERLRRVFVANVNDNTVSVVDEGAARVVRTVPLNAGPLDVAVDKRLGRVFVPDVAGGVSVLDARSGALLHTVTMDQNPVAVAVDERRGRLTILANAGTSVLDTRRLRVLRRIAVGAMPSSAKAHNPSAAAVDTRTGRAFIIDAVSFDQHGQRRNGSVSVLDVQTGRVVGHLSVGQAPMALAVDEEMGRLLVVNMDGAGPGGVTSGSNTWGWVPVGVRRWLPWFRRSAPQAPQADTSGSVSVLDISRL